MRFLQFVGYGVEGSILLLRTCLDQFSLNGGEGEDSQAEREIISSVFKYLLDKPNFCTVFCEALQGSSISDGFLGDLSKALNLSTVERIGVGLALSESENVDFRTRGNSGIYID